MTKEETHIQIMFCRYLNIRYPNIIYRSDLAGIKLTIGQAVQVKKMQSGRAYPDVFIAEPRACFHGLYIEIKAKNEDLYNKNGKLRKSKHVTEQTEMLKLLRKKGYCAWFAVGFDGCVEILERYLNKR